MAELNEAERCPSCGSGKLVLQGRVVSGRTVRELVCLSCEHVWKIDLLEERDRP